MGKCCNALLVVTIVVVQGILASMIVLLFATLYSEDHVLVYCPTKVESLKEKIGKD